MLCFIHRSNSETTEVLKNSEIQSKAKEKVNKGTNNIFQIKHAFMKELLTENKYLQQFTFKLLITIFYYLYTN